MNTLYDPSSPSFTASLRSSVQRNPVAAGFIGLGALWLLLGHRRSLQGIKIAATGVTDGVVTGLKKSSEGIVTGAKAVADSASDAFNVGGEAMSDASEKLSGTARNVRDSVNSLSDATRSKLKVSASDASEALASTARSSGTRARAIFNGLQGVLERQPILLGAIGLAIGSAVAASIPSTHLEGEILGRSSDALKRDLRDSVDRQADQLVDTSKRVLDTIKSEGAEQGLTSDGLKQALQDKMAGFSDALRDSVRERTS